MKYLCCSLFLLILSYVALSQTKQLGDSLRISFLGPDKYPSSSDRVFAIVIYENISEKPVSVYKSLSEGYYNDRFCNLNITLEKKIHKSFREETLMYYKPNPDIYFADSLRHYDLPKMWLLPHQHDTLHYNLIGQKIAIDTGFYRMKISLRVQTILDTSVYHHDPTGAKVFSEDQIKYITSDWIFFKVPRRIDNGPK